MPSSGFVLTTLSGAVLTAIDNTTVIANVTGPFPPVLAATDFGAYIFRYNSLGDAERDPVVAPYFPHMAQEILLYLDRTVDSVTPQSGYWITIRLQGPVPNAFFNDSNLQAILKVHKSGNDVLYTAVYTLFPTQNMIVIIDNFGPMILEGAPLG